MNFGENLQYLRRIHKGMTQEELANKLRVSRQTISKWELNQGNPELNKILDICSLFNCTADDLLFNKINVADEAFSEIKIKKLESFEYIKYTVISKEPEEDAMNKIKQIAKKLKIENEKIIGWDFSYLSQEQINVHHFHGYTAALILPDNFKHTPKDFVIEKRNTQNYVTLEIKNPMKDPFNLIPKAFKSAFQYLKINRYTYDHFAFEMEYEINGIDYMKIYLAILE